MPLPPFKLKKKKITGSKGEKTQIFPLEKDGVWEKPPEAAERTGVILTEYDEESTNAPIKPEKPGSVADDAESEG
jgi:hypothetical protein